MSNFDNLVDASTSGTIRSATVNSKESIQAAYCTLQSSCHKIKSIAIPCNMHLPHVQAAKPFTTEMHVLLQAYVNSLHKRTPTLGSAHASPTTKVTRSVTMSLSTAAARRSEMSPSTYEVKCFAGAY